MCKQHLGGPYIVSMDSDTLADREGRPVSEQPAQDTVSSDAPSKPAFRMPDPPKKKAMAPPPPRFSAPPQQKNTPSPEQASAAGSAPEAVQAKPHATSEAPAEASVESSKDTEGDLTAPHQPPAAAKGLPQPAARPGTAHSCSAKAMADAMSACGSAQSGNHRTVSFSGI